ncbi:helix-turn-helix transcriptional regulator [Philodulcilactobacillus myokoensis]|uniref:helix-turn-helix transcriptional regulator n=1 Tax=Philodulcilactobacillus myokoensis TaxID=2929573 RepID=UPI0025712508|nr:helix-turn-helix transcriptional regulator [Philodulcilactobacillus myokoensis]
MEINGELIKKRRLKMKMSQKDLANKICTQATISLLERNNTCTSFKLLYPICKRLNLPIDKIEKHSKYNKDVLEYIEEQIWKEHYKEALKRWEKIDQHKLDDAESRGRYYCYGGILQIYVKKDYPFAIHYFNFLFDHCRLDSNCFYKIWCQVGMAMSYYYLDHKKASLDYLGEAFRNFTNFYEYHSVDYNLISKMFIKIAKFYLKLGERQRAIYICNQAINLAKRRNVMHNVQHYYFIAGTNLYTLHNNNQAFEYLDHAQHFSKFTHDPVMLKNISEFKKQYPNNKDTSSK